METEPENRAICRWCAHAVYARIRRNDEHPCTRLVIFGRRHNQYIACITIHEHPDVVISELRELANGLGWRIG